MLQPQAERHVVRDRHVRVERIVLEHHGDVAVLRRHIVDDMVIDGDLAVGDVLQPCDHAQRGRLAATGRSDQHDELVILDLEVDAAHRLHIVIALDNLTQRYVGHDASCSALLVAHDLVRNRFTLFGIMR
jgi:hypothetical protein